MRFLLGLVFVLGIAFAQDAGVSEDLVVLRVNGEELLLGEFNERFLFYANNLAAQQGMQMTPDMAPLFDSLKPQYLEQLATEKVVQQEGRRRGLTVEESVVDEQIAQIKTNFDTDEAYLEALSAAGLSSEVLLRTLLAEAELSRQTIEAIRADVNLKPYQLQLYYDLHKAEYATPAEACARHILVATEEDAKTVQTDLASGISFEDEAKAKSTDPGSAERGGDLGCFPQGAMIPVFEAAAFNAPLNEVTEPIQSEFGYHLILPYERTEAVTPSLADVETQVTEGAENEVLRQLLAKYQENASVEVFAELVTPVETTPAEEVAPTEEAAPAEETAPEETTPEESAPSEGQ